MRTLSKTIHRFINKAADYDFLVDAKNEPIAPRDKIFFNFANFRSSTLEPAFKFFKGIVNIGSSKVDGLGGVSSTSNKLFLLHTLQWYTFQIN